MGILTTQAVSVTRKINLAFLTFLLTFHESYQGRPFTRISNGENVWSWNNPSLYIQLQESFRIFSNGQTTPRRLLGQERNLIFYFKTVRMGYLILTEKMERNSNRGVGRKEEGNRTFELQSWFTQLVLPLCLSDSFTCFP